MKQNDAHLLDIIALLNGIPHGVALLDGDFRLLGMNHHLEALTGTSSASSAGIRADLVLRSSIDRKDPVFRAAVDHGGAASAEGDIIGASRKKIPVRLTVAPFSLKQDRQNGLLLYIEDISLFREFEKKHQGLPENKGLLGHSPRIQELLEFLPILAHTEATVLITGETGTGKDMLAEAIHLASRRAAYPFVKVNCGALPESLLESELFGHVRGAFTGAYADKPGMFRLAQGGTLFLTEIGDLPLPLQVKLLTVLDDRAFYPVGGSKKVQVDARVITGTHRNLRALVEEGRFRQDLFFRLNVLHVHMPALHERDGDVRLLADHFLHRFAAAAHKDIKKFSRDALALLDRYRYPGNVRELRNIVEYAVSVCKGNTIGQEHLPDYIHQNNKAASAAPGPISNAVEKERPPPAPTAIEGDPRLDPLAGEKNWPEAERKLIMTALLQCRGNRSEAAALLGWGRSTLWRKMKQHKIG